jgi:outer membrane protein TolC
VLTKTRFARGLNTEIDVLLAHAQWVQLQNDVTNLKAQAVDDRLSLIAALGGGYQPTAAPEASAASTTTK